MIGHIIGLPDTGGPGVMEEALDTGERRLPDASDVALSPSTPLPNIALGAHAPIVIGTPGSDFIDAGHGGNILVGGAGADNFVFANVEIHATTPWSLMSALLGTPPVTPPALTHVADYSFAQGDSFDFSALTSAFHGSWASDAQIVRAVEDPSGLSRRCRSTPAARPSGPGSIMLLQGNFNGRSNSTASWVDVAQLDGAHVGDTINVLIDSHATIHATQIHVDWLV